MGLFVNQDGQRTELQKRLETELRDKEKAKAKLDNVPDGVEDSQYISGTKVTTSLAWAWILIVVAAVGIAIWLMALGISQR